MHAIWQPVIFDSLLNEIRKTSINRSNVPEECPVMCGICKPNGSPGNDFVPAPSTNLIAG